MCKQLYYILCCMCCRKKNKRNANKDDSDHYGTNWETPEYKGNIQSFNDKGFDYRIVSMNATRFESQTEWYKEILRKHDYQMVSEEPVGKGGFGCVYKIQYLPNGSIRALKTLRVRKQNQMSDNQLTTFRNEIIALKKTCHQNIIQLFDYFFIPNTMCFMILEFATEGDLRKRLKDRYKKTRHAFNEEESNGYFVQIANALNFVHKKGFFHGDLKLDNVLITKRGNTEVVKVTDFGCSQVGFTEEKGYIMRNSALGTILYMSPEQLRVYLCVNLKNPNIFKTPSKKYNPMKSDIWAFGVCLYRLLFYEHPFDYDLDQEIKSLQLMLKDMKKGFISSSDSKRVSNDCMDLMKSLMDYNKNSRIDMKDVMNHIWLRNSPKLDKPNM